MHQVLVAWLVLVSFFRRGKESGEAKTTRDGDGVLKKRPHQESRPQLCVRRPQGG